MSTDHLGAMIDAFKKSSNPMTKVLDIKQEAGQKVHVLTDVEWYETVSLYKNEISETFIEFGYTPVYINRPPNWIPVAKNYDTNTYHYFTDR